MSPQEMLQESQAETRDTEAVYQKAIFYCASTDSADSCPKAEPQEQRGLTLYTLASRLQKQKEKFNPHMAACDFIGYFIPSVLRDLLHVSILSFISLLCHPFPLLHIRRQICLFLFWSSSLLQYSDCLASMKPHVQAPIMPKQNKKPNPPCPLKKLKR
jgi:hypothetical protein